MYYTYFRCAKGCNVFVAVVVSVPVFDTLPNTGCVLIQFTLAT